jgi:hypothetical protein
MKATYQRQREVVSVRPQSFRYMSDPDSIHAQRPHPLLLFPLSALSNPGVSFSNVMRRSRHTILFISEAISLSFKAPARDMSGICAGFDVAGFVSGVCVAIDQ